jgi:mono/diheme cytochrome c family protein
LFIVSFLIAACSLAEDTTPPPGYVPPQPTATPEPSVPKVKPSIVRGAEVYAQNCTRCHGVSGNADGEMVSKITVPVPAFTDPQFALNTTPQRWFAIITNGNIDRFMPPWGETLSEADRWHVIAYLYSLSATPPNIKAGQAVYAAACQQCHGQTGTGDGPQAQGSLPDFTSQAYMSAKSNAEFLASLSLPNHSFVNQLTEPEQKNVVGFVRSFALNAEAPKVEKGHITGLLTNGTPGGTVPAGQEVTLRVFDNFQEQTPLTTTAKPDGSFEFSGLDLPSGRAFIVTSRYNNVLYTSEVAQTAPDTFSFDLPVTLYESTTDPVGVAVDRLHLVFDFQPGVVQVGELISISNSSDKTFTSPAPNGPTLKLALPAGYSELTFQDGALGDRYQKTADGFADTLPIAPGPNARQILLSYKLPYTGALAFSQLLPYPVTAINVLVPDVGVTANSPALVDAGVSQLQGGGAFHTYTLADLPANSTLTFDLKGEPTVTSGTTTDTQVPSPSVPNSSINWRDILIGFLSLALAGSIGAYWWLGRNQPNEILPDQQSLLLSTLAQLDDDFAAGKIEAVKYRARREKLIAELKQVMQKP